ncbi:MAG TPA: HEPN domain-containing protein, partial [Candidatus Thermoplasmatota archaeon]|nr:HEPN domain-containing protein [Candidatus Thermoplasmatota archaeon]
AAYAVVRTKGHAPKTHRSLSGLVSQEFLGAHGFSRAQLAALKTGQSIRELGDYEATVPPTEETAETLLAQAEEMVGRAKEIVG